MRITRPILRGVAVLSIVLWASPAFAIYFDLHGLTPSTAFNYNLSAGGINVTVGGSGFLLKSGPATLGIDSNSANDNPNLVDGGGGSAESFAILFGQTVLLESIQISQFDPGDAGTFNIKGGSTFSLQNGLNTVNNFASSGANFLRWTGDTVSGGTRGFSVDGFSARLAGTPPAQAGDYNANGKVDAADYVLWRNTQGFSVVPYNFSDGSGDGTVNAEDYAPWRAALGKAPAVRPRRRRCRSLRRSCCSLQAFLACFIFAA